jgi:hypothetical protein
METHRPKNSVKLHARVLHHHQQSPTVSNKENNCQLLRMPTATLQFELTLGQYEPGHCELWLLWGKDNTFYREKLPIFPLPTFIFLPEIIQQLEKVYPKPHDVLANIDQKDSTYTLAIYDKSPHQEQPCRIDKELTIAMLPKKVFAPYVQAILQNEHYKPRQTVL